MRLLDATAGCGRYIKGLGAEQRAARINHTTPTICGVKATLRIAAPQLPASTVERVKRWEKRKANDLGLLPLKIIHEIKQMQYAICNEVHDKVELDTIQPSNSSSGWRGAESGIKKYEIVRD